MAAVAAAVAAGGKTLPSTFFIFYFNDISSKILYYISEIPYPSGDNMDDHLDNERGYKSKIFALKKF